MEHIVNISFAIDDSDMARRIEQELINEGITEVKKRIDENLERTTWNEDKRIIEITYALMKGFIKDYKEEIIEKASSKLADRLSRTKAVKEQIISEVNDGKTC